MTMCNGIVTYENGRSWGIFLDVSYDLPLRGKLDVRTVEQIGSAFVDMMPEPRSTHDTLVKDADLEVVQVLPYVL